MEKAIFQESLKRMGLALELPSPIYVNDSLRVSLVINDSSPLVLNLSYDPDNKKVKIESPLCFSLPSSIDGLQTMMVRLAPDLVAMGKESGKLVADPDEDRIDLVKELEIGANNLDALAKFVPGFIKKSLSWRKKVAHSLNTLKASSCLKEEEILNFSYQIS